MAVGSEPALLQGSTRAESPRPEGSQVQLVCWETCCEMPEVKAVAALQRTAFSLLDPAFSCLDDGAVIA